MPFGTKRRVVDPVVAPSSVASPTARAASAAVRCWRSKPGRSRLARMPVMANASPVHRLNASAVRSNCPPPAWPSNSIMSFSCPLPRPRAGLIPSTFHADHLAQGVDDFDEVFLRRHYRFDGLVSGRRLVDHIRVLAALY